MDCLICFLWISSKIREAGVRYADIKDLNSGRLYEKGSVVNTATQYRKVGRSYYEFLGVE